MHSAKIGLQGGTFLAVFSHAASSRPPERGCRCYARAVMTEEYERMGTRVGRRWPRQTIMTILVLLPLVTLGYGWHTPQVVGAGLS